MLFSCYVYRMCWVFGLVFFLFFFHSPYVDLFGKDSSVDTKQHFCMFHKLQDKKQLSFIFQLFSLVSVECNHTHAESLKYKDLSTFTNQFSPHLISAHCDLFLYMLIMKKGVFIQFFNLYQDCDRTLQKHSSEDKHNLYSFLWWCKKTSRWTNAKMPSGNINNLQT